MKFDFEIDTAWCLEQAFKDGKISDRDRMLVQTTHRQREQLKWHPLQWIANFNLVDRSHPQNTLTLNRLCQWLSRKNKICHFILLIL